MTICPLDPEYKVTDDTTSFRMPLFYDTMQATDPSTTPSFHRDMYERVEADKVRETVRRTVERMQTAPRVPRRQPIPSYLKARRVPFGTIVRPEEDVTRFFPAAEERQEDETDRLIQTWTREQERINAREGRKHFKRIRTFFRLVRAAYDVARIQAR
jgi:hypothetical protein